LAPLAIPLKGTIRILLIAHQEATLPKQCSIFIYDAASQRFVRLLQTEELTSLHVYYDLLSTIGRQQVEYWQYGLIVTTQLLAVWQNQ